MRLSRPMMTILLLTPLAACAAGAACADSIELHRAVRMPENRAEILLRDIAFLEGDAARALADTVIVTLDDAGRLQDIPLQDIRDSLEAAGAHWGTIHLTGGAVTLRPRRDEPAATPAAMQGISIDGDDEAPVVMVSREYRENVFLAVGIVHESTLRGAIAQRFAHELQVQPQDLQLSFDIEDEALLAMPLQKHRFEIDPMSQLDAEQVDLAIREWGVDSIVLSETVSVQPRIRFATMMLTRDVRRGEPIDATMLKRTEEWLSPAVARIYALQEHAIGCIASHSLRTGDPLRRRDVEAPNAIRRGDRVNVRCISGSVVITLAAEARDDGAAGEQIEFRKLGERDTFIATVAAPGEAVVNLSKTTASAGGSR